MALFQVAGEDPIIKARDKFDKALKHKLKQSLLLVNHASNGNVEKMYNELVNNEDPNSKNKDKTALLAAINSKNPNAVKVLCEFNVSMEMERKKSVLVEAVSCNSSHDMIKILIDEGAPVGDESLLGEAINHSLSHAIIKLLFDADAPMNDVYNKSYYTNVSY